LANSDQLDTRQGLVVMRGNVSKYLNLLRQFTANHADDARQLREDVEGSRLGEARQRVHTLKGAAGTLGAVTLHGAAQALELTIRAQRPVKELTLLVDALQTSQTALAQVLRNTVSTIAPNPMEAPTFATTPAGVELSGPKAAYTVLKLMLLLLVRFDTASADLFDAHRATLVVNLGPNGALLGRELANFDYPGAVQAVQDALSVGTLLGVNHDE
jgi:HPt (histidine-containing phosphotransfer) domain-containing protein